MDRVLYDTELGEAFEPVQGLWLRSLLFAFVTPLFRLGFRVEELR